MRFTVLIPTHNRPDVLRFAIESVLAQTFADYELLIVGDGCTDSTADTVRSFRDSRIRWLDLPKAPYFGAANRNRALRQARGEIIAYLSHDDLWFHDHLEILDQTFRAELSELVYTLLLTVSSDGILMPRVANLFDPATFARLRSRIGLGISCVAHLRDCLEKYGYWSETLPSGADAELWNRIITLGGKQNFSYVPVPTAVHFIANWRKQARRTTLKLMLYRWEGSLSPVLAIPEHSGITQQEALWRHLKEFPAARARDMRRAVQLDADRRASAVYPSAMAMYAYEQFKRWFYQAGPFTRSSSAAGPLSLTEASARDSGHARSSSDDQTEGRGQP